MDESNSFLSPADLAVSAVILPPVIALINQKTWKKEVRALVALGVCVIYSMVSTLLRPNLNWSEWRDVLLQAMLGAFGAYKLFWGPSNIADDIEEATTFHHVHHQADPQDSPPDSQ